MPKINQEQLNNLLTENIHKSEINLRKLLKEKGYIANLDGLYFDGNILNNSEYPTPRTLLFSNLSLVNTKFVDLKAKLILFNETDLSKAKIIFKSVESLYFLGSNLSHCYINEIKTKKVSFFRSSLNKTMIFRGIDSEQSFLSSDQNSEVVSLDVDPSSKVNQVEMLKKYSEELPLKGHCYGIEVERARHNLKAKIRGGESNFVEKWNRKKDNYSHNFIQRLVGYQNDLNLSGSVLIDKSKIESFDFVSSLHEESRISDGSDVLCCVTYINNQKEKHSFTVNRVRGIEGEVKGYVIFDSNIGEIRCDSEDIVKNEEKCNQQMNLLYNHYQENITYGKRTFVLMDLEKFLVNSQIVRKDGEYKKEDKYVDKIVPSSKELDSSRGR